MKFLVIGKLRAIEAHPTIADYEGNLSLISGWLKSGAMDCIYALADGGGVGIMNADSTESLMDLLLELPLYSFTQWEVHPLADYPHIVTKIIEVSRRRPVSA